MTSNIAREKANASTKSLLVMDNWAPDPKDQKKSMSLGTIQRAGTAAAKTRCAASVDGIARPGTSLLQRNPCSLSTEGIELKTINPVVQAVERGAHLERPAVSLVNFNKEYAQEQKVAAVLREADYKRRGVDAEAAGFIRGANTTYGILGAQPRPAVGGSSTFHSPSGNGGERSQAPKRDPMNPHYTLAVKNVAPQIEKTDFSAQVESSQQQFSRLTAGRSQSAAAASAAPKHLWDVTDERTRANRMDTARVNGERRKVTKLKPKPADKASGYFDYSDIARSTNRWYCELQERRANGKPNLILTTSDVNQKRQSWNERYDQTTGKIEERKTDPLTPRYTHDGEPYGDFEKGVRTGMRRWKSSRNKSHVESTLDVEGAQPSAHGMPRSLESHRQKFGEAPEAVIKTMAGMSAGKARRHETNDVLGADEMNNQAVALGGSKAAAYGLPFRTEQQLQYSKHNSSAGQGRAAKSVKGLQDTLGTKGGGGSLERPQSAAVEAVSKEINDQWNIIHLSAKHTNRSTVNDSRGGGGSTHAACSFKHEVNGGRQTNPVMPMYDYQRPSTHNMSHIPESQAWDPVYQRLATQPTGATGRNPLSTTSGDDVKARKQMEKSMRDFHHHQNKISKSSRVSQLKSDVNMVRSLPNPEA